METFSLLAHGMILIISKSVFLWVVRRKVVHPVFVLNYFTFFLKGKRLLSLFILCLTKIGHGLVQAFLSSLISLKAWKLLSYL